MTEATFAASSDPWNWALSAMLILLWLLASWRWMRHAGSADVAGAQWLVIHASQTGQAEDLARAAHFRIAAALGGHGKVARLASANGVSADDLLRVEGLIVVAATTGEGEAPDNAVRFERAVMAAWLDLTGKQAAILALGDRRYPHFCAFGQRLATWLESTGATLLAAPVLVDDHDPEALSQWNKLLAGNGFPDVAQAREPSVQQWQIVAQELVAAPCANSTSGQSSDGLYHVVLQRFEGSAHDWQIGDLFELHTPCGHLRDYSIANRPGSEEIHLFVRRVLHEGRPGRGSGLLTAETCARIIKGRVRPHPSFRPAAGTGPLLAIGAGSGWAGLRPHVLDALSKNRPCWIIFGERKGAGNEALLGEMQQWQRAGELAGLHFALSTGNGPYVQHIVAEQAAQLVELLRDDAAVVLCGRLAMGQACLAELERIAGHEWLDRAREEGRLRTDFY